MSPLVSYDSDMPLPILSHHPKPTSDDLVRFFHRCELQWCRQTAEETPLDTGTALTNPQLANVWSANLILDGALAEGMMPQRAYDEVEAHFKSQNVRCHKWVLNPAMPIERTQPLADHLVSLGYRRVSGDIMYLEGAPAGAVTEVAGLQIFPARASFRHARELVAESA